MAVVKVRRKNGWAWKATIRDTAGRQISETFPYDEQLKDAGKAAAQRWGHYRRRTQRPPSTNTAPGDPDPVTAASDLGSTLW